VVICLWRGANAHYKDIGTLCRELWKMGEPILMIYTSMTCFPRRMSVLEVLLIMLPIYGVMSTKKLHVWGVNRHFEAKLADCGGWLFAVCRWIAFRRLQVKCFLRMSVLGSVHTTGDHRPCVPSTRKHVTYMTHDPWLTSYDYCLSFVHLLYQQPTLSHT